MGKFVMWFIVGLCVLALVFNFMPTGHSSAEIMSGFQESTSVQGSVQSSKLVGMYRAVENSGLVRGDDVNSVREAVCLFAVKLAGQYGCGWYKSSSDYEFAQQKFQYSASNSANDMYGVTWGTTYNGHSYAGYSTFDDLYDHLYAITQGTFDKDYQNISCAAYATFCAGAVISYPELYKRGGGDWGRARPDILRAEMGSDNGTTYVKENAKPGDLIEFYSDAACTSGEHTALYIGSYTFTDSSGNEVTFEHAVVQSSWHTDGNHVKINDLSDSRCKGIIPLDLIISELAQSSESEIMNLIAVDPLIQAVFALPYEAGTFNDLEGG